MNSKLEIVHLISGDFWGGKESQVYAQVLELKKLEEKVQVILLNEGLFFDELKKLGVDVWVANEERGSAFLLFQLFFKLRYLKPTHVITHGYKETILIAFARLFSNFKQIVVFHGLPETYKGLKGVKLKLLEKLQRIIAKVFASHIVCVSKNILEEYGFNINKTTVIENSYLKLSDTHKSYPNSILFLSRLYPIKRPKLALRAFYSSLKDIDQSIDLVFIGEGPLLRDAKNLAKELKIEKRVSFLGHIPLADSLVASFKMLLITSDSEGIPTVLLQAIKSGIPIAATAVGGIPEVMSKFLNYPYVAAEKGNANSLAKSIKRALDKRSLNEKELQETKAILDKEFSPEVVCKKYLEVYRDCN